MNGDNLVGEILAERYEILDKIGTGGMATVYKAKDTILNRKVAIKILRDALEGEESVVTNFVKEAQASAGLVHNNIVSVYDVCETDNLNYMVMELVEGITLKKYIKEKGMLPWQEACDYAIQIGQGLSEAHSKNVIHCDIKPQNIIMTADKTLKVADFGIAKAVSGGTMVVGGAALGSVHYISPEQARGGFTDPRSDIYSMGVVLYEMLAGRVPFDGDSAVGIAMKHLEEEPVDVRCINLDIPVNLAYIVMKAISKEQASRYQTVQDMLNDLHAVLASEPLPSKILDVSEVEEPENEIEDITDDIFDEKTKNVTNAMSDNQRKARTKNADNGKSKNKKTKKTNAQKKANRIATLLAFATIAVIALIGVGVYNIVTNFVMRVSVPDFTNMTIEEARVLAEEKSLVILDEDIEYSISDTTTDGRIITQEPQKGDSVEKDSHITLVVSIGSRGGNIPVPNLKNMSRTEALETINTAGLKVTVIEENSKTVSGDKVIRQIPIAGTKLFAGDYVTIYVSKGTPKPTDDANEKKVSVPGLVGVNLDEARIRLSESGLSLGNVNVTASAEPYGTVLSQAVGEGAQVNRGSSIGVVISGGTEVVEAPVEGEETEENQNQNPENGDTENTGSESTGQSSGTTTFFVSIPEGDSSETVYVEVYVNGSLIHEGDYSKGTGTVPVDISGSGEVNVVAYVDGVSQSQTIDFNN